MVSQSVGQNLDGMKAYSICRMFNLVAAGGAGRTNNCIRISLSNRWSQAHFCQFNGQVLMLFFVPK